MRTHPSGRSPWLLTIAALAISSFSSASVARLSGQQASAVSTETKCPENEPGLFHACALARGRSFDPPRTPDGRPDFQGWWQSPLGGTQNIEEHPRTPATPAGKSLVVDPASGRVLPNGEQGCKRRSHGLSLSVGRVRCRVACRR